MRGDMGTGGVIMLDEFDPNKPILRQPNIKIMLTDEAGSEEVIWLTVARVNECSPAGLRMAVEFAAQAFLESMARDLCNG